VVYKLFLGITKLSDKKLFPVVAEGYDATNLPFVKGSTVLRQVRFYWDKDHKDQNNHDAINKMATYAKSHGGQLCGGSGELLAVILLGDLENRFITKYASLRKVWRATNKDVEVEGSVPKKEMTKSKRDNRARGVSYMFSYIEQTE
jgi:hypothetical protein